MKRSSSRSIIFFVQIGVLFVPFHGGKIDGLAVSPGVFHKHTEAGGVWPGLSRVVRWSPPRSATWGSTVASGARGNRPIAPREGVWPRTDHLMESAQFWLASNGAECDWLECARLVASRAIAEEEGAVSFPKDDADLLRLFNLCTGWFLDYRSPVVQRIHVRCASYLKAS